MQQTGFAQQDAKRHAVVTGSLPHHFSPIFAKGANLGGMSMPQGLQNLPNLQNLLGTQVFLKMRGKVWEIDGL